ncbi:hypothetical protein ACIO87_23225 [Streptomyces sp. NPDC087218]
MEKNNDPLAVEAGEVEIEELEQGTNSTYTLNTAGCFTCLPA